MSRSTCVLIVFSLTALACGGGQVPQDSGPVTVSDSPEGRIEVDSEICQDYLDCLAATRPEALADDEDEYGLDGDCWQGGDPDRCEQVCESLHADLWEQNPREPSCGEVSLCPEGGQWAMRFGETEGGCSYNGASVELICSEQGDTWIFDIEDAQSGQRLWTCDGIGTTAEFSCKSKAYQATAEGRFVGNYDAAEGIYTIDIGDPSCDGDAYWSLTK